jgi:hypothetical protein
MEGPGDLLPAQPLRPTGQKPSVRDRQVALALRPRHPFCLHSAAGTVHPAQRVEEEDDDPPQGHELKTALGQGVITRPSLTPEHPALPVARARISISSTRRPPSSRSRIAPYTKRGCLSIRFRIVLSCIPFSSPWLVLRTHCHTTKENGMLHFSSCPKTSAPCGALRNGAVQRPAQTAFEPFRRSPPLNWVPSAQRNPQILRKNPFSSTCRNAKMKEANSIFLWK